MKNLILIAEDEPRNMKLVRDLLQFSGYTTLEAVNGRQAVEITYRKQPALILMDIQMPVLNGLEAIQLLKHDKQVQHIPIVALTALAMKGDREKIIAAGADAYLSKPLDLGQLLATVARYIPKVNQVE